jgi:hypothetical protein
MESQQGSHVPGATEHTSLAYLATAPTAALSLVRVVANRHQRQCRLWALNPGPTHYESVKLLMLHTYMWVVVRQEVASCVMENQAGSP